jgi:hypothetical protein
MEQALRPSRRGAFLFVVKRHRSGTESARKRHKKRSKRSAKAQQQAAAFPCFGLASRGGEVPPGVGGGAFTPSSAEIPPEPLAGRGRCLCLPPARVPTIAGKNMQRAVIRARTVSLNSPGPSAAMFCPLIFSLCVNRRWTGRGRRRGGRGALPTPSNRCYFLHFFSILLLFKRKKHGKTSCKQQQKQRKSSAFLLAQHAAMAASCQQVTVPEPPGQKEKRLNLKEESLVFVLYLSFAWMLRCTQSCSWRSESVVRCRRER